MGCTQMYTTGAFRVKGGFALRTWIWQWCILSAMTGSTVAGGSASWVAFAAVVNEIGCRKFLLTRLAVAIHIIVYCSE